MIGNSFGGYSILIEIYTKICRSWSTYSCIKKPNSLTGRDSHIVEVVCIYQLTFYKIEDFSSFSGVNKNLDKLLKDMD